MEKGDVKVHVDDPLGRSDDYTRLITYVVSALGRALDGRLVSCMGKLVKLHSCREVKPHSYMSSG